jgi:hypothetical protein
MAGFPKQDKKLGEKAKRPKPGIPLVKEKLIELIKLHNGNLSRVADQLGTTRHAIRRRCDADEELDKALIDARERLLDDLEEHSWHRAQKGDTTLSIFLLKTIGKGRGYEQDSAQQHAQDIAKAAFDFVLNKSKNPAEQ